MKSIYCKPCRKVLVESGAHLATPGPLDVLFPGCFRCGSLQVDNRGLSAPTVGGVGIDTGRNIGAFSVRLTDEGNLLVDTETHHLSDPFRAWLNHDIMLGSIIVKTGAFPAPVMQLVRENPEDARGIQEALLALEWKL